MRISSIQDYLFLEPMAHDAPDVAEGRNMEVDDDDDVFTFPTIHRDGPRRSDSQYSSLSSSATVSVTSPDVRCAVSLPNLDIAVVDVADIHDRYGSSAACTVLTNTRRTLVAPPCGCANSDVRTSQRPNRRLDSFCAQISDLDESDCLVSDDGDTASSDPSDTASLSNSDERLNAKQDKMDTVVVTSGDGMHTKLLSTTGSEDEGIADPRYHVVYSKDKVECLAMFV